MVTVILWVMHTRYHLEMEFPINIQVIKNLLLVVTQFGIKNCNSKRSMQYGNTGYGVSTFKSGDTKLE